MHYNIAMSTVHVHYCKPPHLTIDELENGVKWLLLLQGVRSFVCCNFRFPSRKGKIIEADKKRILSKLCSSNFTYTGNTTNMWNHLKEHRQEFRQTK